MPCFHPLRGYRGPFPGKNGKYRITGIHQRKLESAAPAGAVAVDLPCGQCIGCRLERSRKWAVRCVLESQLHQDNCFLTLTYRPENLPIGGTLVKRDFQLFMKRLRKANGDKKIRFFACGEYGEGTHRPHYHACLFGYDPPDKVIHTVRDGVPLFTSAAIGKLWPFGFNTVGAVTFESAAYVARYVMKKVTGNRAAAHYTVLDQETGELIERTPEFVLMSRGGRNGRGIAAEWFEKYQSDVYPHDFVVARGQRMKPPRYFDKLLELEDAALMAELRDLRLKLMDQQRENNSLSRLKVREKVTQSKLNQLKRGLQDEV